MALEMKFVDKTGTEHPESYWKIQSLDSFYGNGKRAGILVLAYHNAATKEAGMIPIAEKRYQIMPQKSTNAEGTGLLPAFDELFSEAIISPAESTPLRQIYKWLKTTNDFEGATDA